MTLTMQSPLCALFLVVMVLTLLQPTPALAATTGKYLVYVGTYTDHGGKGIYAYRFDAGTGQAPRWVWRRNRRTRSSSPSMPADISCMRSTRFRLTKASLPGR